MTIAEQTVEPDVIIWSEGTVGRITLNRPRALHALTLDMCRTIIAALLDWRDDPGLSLVMIDHAGDRGFCAGGDIRLLAQSGADDGVAADQFFRTEYQLNHLLFTYPKPTVAVIDGLVMGGGVGLSMPCRYRLATERTAFAMPETGIGLFPDVGAGWYLPRLPGMSGIWLGLTGARIGGPDCLALGVVTHLVTADSLATLKRQIGADPVGAPAALAQASTRPPQASFELHRSAMDKAFSADTVTETIEQLSRGGDWEAHQADILRTRCPTSLEVTLRHLRNGSQAASFAEVMASELRIATRMVRRLDFAEGVRAVVVEKDNRPRWSPARLAEVSPAILDSIFAPLPADQEWSPLDPGATL